MPSTSQPTRKSIKDFRRRGRTHRTSARRLDYVPIRHSSLPQQGQRQLTRESSNEERFANRQTTRPLAEHVRQISQQTPKDLEERTPFPQVSPSEQAFGTCSRSALRRQKSSCSPVLTSYSLSPHNSSEELAGASTQVPVPEVEATSRSRYSSVPSVSSDLYFLHKPRVRFPVSSGPPESRLPTSENEPEPVSELYRVPSPLLYHQKDLQPATRDLRRPVWQTNLPSQDQQPQSLARAAGSYARSLAPSISSSLASANLKTDRSVQDPEASDRLCSLKARSRKRRRANALCRRRTQVVALPADRHQREAGFKCQERDHTRTPSPRTAHVLYDADPIVPQNLPDVSGDEHGRELGSPLTTDLLQLQKDRDSPQKFSDNADVSSTVGPSIWICQGGLVDVAACSTRHCTAIVPAHPFRTRADEDPNDRRTTDQILSCQFVEMLAQNLGLETFHAVGCVYAEALGKLPYDTTTHVVVQEQGQQTGRMVHIRGGTSATGTTDEEAIRASFMEDLSRRLSRSRPHTSPEIAASSREDWEDWEEETESEDDVDYIGLRSTKWEKAKNTG